MMDVSERSYKGYELGKREPSLISVINFCERFEVDCGWLVWGGNEPRTGSDAALALQVTDSIYTLLHDRGRRIGPRKFAYYSRIVLDNCRTNGTSPAEEATRLLPLIEEDETGVQ